MSTSVELTGWAHDNLPLVFLAISLLFMALLWAANKLIENQKELTREKEKHANIVDKKEKEIDKKQKELNSSEFSRVADKIEELVNQNQFLFKKYDKTEEDVTEIRGEISELKKKVGQHLTKCDEREKIIKTIQERQDFSIKKFDKALIERSGVAKRIDRTCRPD